MVFGEDGIGSYTGAIYDRLFYLDETCSSSFPNLKKRLLSRFARIFYGDRLLMRPSKIYLHLPSFSLVVQPCDICEMSHNEEYVDYCARFYVSAFKDAFDKNYEEFDFLFLGQPPENAQEKAAYDMAIKTVDRIGCNYAYRKHPREQIDRVHNSGGLWEFRCLAEIHDDSILVSSFSTAAITPLLYYGKKPWLLFFYPMVNGLSEENRKRLDAMAEALRSEYKLPEKVMVAENAKALASQLERLVALRKAVRSNTEAVRVHDESA